MKRTLALTLLGIAAATTAFGQGAFLLHNYAAPYVPITGPSGIIGAASGVQIQVWAAPGDVAAGALTFLANSQWSAFDGYLSKTQIHTIPAGQYTPASTWTFQLRATGSIGGQAVDEFASRGPLVVTSQIGNLGGSPPETAKLNYSPGFVVVVPEPSTFALAGLGAAALLIFRRRA
jgi:hypothetical protein